MSTTSSTAAHPGSAADPELGGAAQQSLRWKHASMAVLVPVTATPGRRRQALTREWRLQHLFPRSKSGLSNPNEVTWDPIADQRIHDALHPVKTELYLAAAKAPSTEGGDNADETEPAGPGDGPPVLKQAEPLGPLLARAGWRAGGPSDGGLHNETQLPDGCTVRAIEVLTYATIEGAQPARHNVPPVPEPQMFLVLHLVLSDAALHDPGRTAAFFGRPSTRDDERMGYRKDSAEFKAQLPQVISLDGWASLLRALDLEPIGPGAGLRVWRPFVLSHLVPEDRPPTAPFTRRPGLGHWGEAELWAWRMTGGQWLTQTWAPGCGPNDAATRTSWFGPTLARAEQGGLAFVATHGLSAPHTGYPREGATWWLAAERFTNVEHVRTAALVHRQGVLLAALAIRQAERLQRHAEELPRIKWPAGTSTPKSREADVDEYAVAANDAADLELDLLHTRNRLWFTQLPGREVETTMLRLLQDAMQTPQLLADISSEQEQVARVLVQRSARMEAQRQADEAERQSRVDNFLNILSAALGFVFVIDIAFAVTQTKQAGGWSPVGVTLAIAIPLAALGVLLLRGVLARLERGTGRAAGASTSAAGAAVADGRDG